MVLQHAFPGLLRGRHRADELLVAFFELSIGAGLFGGCFGGVRGFAFGRIFSRGGVENEKEAGEGKKRLQHGNRGREEWSHSYASGG